MFRVKKTTTIFLIQLFDCFETAVNQGYLRTPKKQKK